MLQEFESMIEWERKMKELLDNKKNIMNKFQELFEQKYFRSCLSQWDANNKKLGKDNISFDGVYIYDVFPQSQQVILQNPNDYSFSKSIPAGTETFQYNAEKDMFELVV